MKGWGNKYRDFLLALISFWVLLSPSYCLFYSLDEADIFCRPHWEKFDSTELLEDVPDVQEELVGSGRNDCAYIIAQEKALSKLLPDFSFPPSQSKHFPSSAARKCFSLALHFQVNDHHLINLMAVIPAGRYS